MSYERVIPRDLFNEAKLLKCLGQLALLLHNYEGRWPVSLHHESPEEGFQIELNQLTGELECTNVVLTMDVSGEIITLGSTYNSKEPYPLNFLSEDEETSGDVFNDDGTFSADFLKFISDS